MRRWLPLLVLALGVALAAGCGGSSKKKEALPPYQHFFSRPDLKPPIVKVTTPAHGTAPGYIFLGAKMRVVQAGPMIVDDRGQLVWFHPLDTKGVADVRAQTYRGQPVITWWRGKAPMGIGSGYYVIYDSSYRELMRVHAANGLSGDVHEFIITPRNTAIFTVYHHIKGYAGLKEVIEGVVQEVALPSGRLLFEWHSLPQIGLKESYVKPPKKGGYDYFHINSVQEDGPGRLLISARNTRAIYEVERKDGKILWRLGGKKGDFSLGPGVRFAWQHDARWRPDGTMTVFDNGAAPPVEKYSRALILRVDPKRRRATLVRAFAHPGKKLLAGSQGDMQLLPDGHFLVGWGAQPYFTEFDSTGRVLFDAHLVGGADSYRAYRLPWVGHPGGRPAIALRNGVVYVSWNGATEVARWQLIAGADAQHLASATTVPKRGFETAIDTGDRAYVAVEALDSSGQVLGRSRTLARSGG